MSVRAGSCTSVTAQSTQPDGPNRSVVCLSPSTLLIALARQTKVLGLLMGAGIGAEHPQGSKSDSWKE